MKQYFYRGMSVEEVNCKFFNLFSVYSGMSFRLFFITLFIVVSFYFTNNSPNIINSLAQTQIILCIFMFLLLVDLTIYLKRSHRKYLNKQNVYRSEINRRIYYTDLVIDNIINLSMLLLIPQTVVIIHYLLINPF